MDKQLNTADPTYVPLGTITKLVVCLAMLLTAFVVVGGVNAVSFQEYYFSYPPKLDEKTGQPASGLPAISTMYFRYYRYSWFLIHALILWCVWLVARRSTTINAVAIFAACAMLLTVTFATIAVIAIYSCNQTFVFKGQHLR